MSFLWHCVKQVPIKQTYENDKDLASMKKESLYKESLYKPVPIISLSSAHTQAHKETQFIETQGITQNARGVHF